jgi:PilZ domain
MRHAETDVADLYEMTGRDDQRGQPRKPTRISAWADPGGASPAVDCVIVDMSEDGARLVSATGAPLPETFALQIANAEVAKATVMWRAERMVGVKFLRPKAD